MCRWRQPGSDHRFTAASTTSRRPGRMWAELAWPIFWSPWDLGCGGFAVGRQVLAVEARELKDGVDGDFEGAGVALNLGEVEAALEGGEEGDGEVVRVGAVREVPGGVKTAE